MNIFSRATLEFCIIILPLETQHREKTFSYFPEKSYKKLNNFLRYALKYAHENNYQIKI